jgi:hypothetical protein
MATGINPAYFIVIEKREVPPEGCAKNLSAYSSFPVCQLPAVTDGV